MNCPNCARTNPEDAQFCIYCATSFGSSVTTAEPKPATGPTTRLDPAVVPAYILPAAAPVVQPQTSAQSMAPARSFNKESIGAVWLIGLGILFLTRDFFPGILVLIGITSYLSANAHGRSAAALQPLMFFVGLAAIFWIGFSIPLVLLWLGLMALFNQKCR